MPDQNRSEQTDVLVIGAGMAGYAAAIAAREAGAQVILAEKMGHDGGSSILSGTTFAFAGTPLQATQGIEDDAETLRADLLDVGGHKNDPAMVDLYVAHQLETFGWLRDIGVVFQEVQLSSNMSRPRSHPAVPAQIFQSLRERAAALGLDLRTGYAARRLIQRSDGTVTGAEFATPDGPLDIRAKGGVILATGGFARSDRLVQTFAPDQAPALRLGGAGSHGDGLTMAWALGADMADMGYAKATFGIAYPDYPGSGRAAFEDDRALLHAMYRGAIAVNREGQRFIAESASYKVLGDACLKQRDALAFQIFDSQVMAESREAPCTHNYRAAEAAGLLIRADTIEALAEAAGLPAEAVTAAVSAYNDACDGSQTDAFGRTTLGMGYGAPRRIDQAPFYAYPCTSGLFSTYSGLRTGADLQVRRVDGTTICDLYAAGEVLGGFHGKGYMSGSAIGKSAVFGRLAGQSVARKALAANARDRETEAL